MQALSQLSYGPRYKTILTQITDVGKQILQFFCLREAGKIVVLSVAEGDDKPAKYPAIFAKSKALLINKIDLLAGGQVDVDIEKAKADARKLNSSCCGKRK